MGLWMKLFSIEKHKHQNQLDSFFFKITFQIIFFSNHLNLSNYQFLFKSPWQLLLVSRGSVGHETHRLLFIGVRQCQQLYLLTDVGAPAAFRGHWFRLLPIVSKLSKSHNTRLGNNINELRKQLANNFMPYFVWQIIISPTIVYLWFIYSFHWWRTYRNYFLIGKKKNLNLVSIVFLDVFPTKGTQTSPPSKGAILI